MNEGLEPEILRADPAWRRKVLIALPVVALLGLAGLIWLDHELTSAQDLAEQSLPDGASRMLTVSVRAFRTLGAGMIAVAAYLGWYGARVLKSAQFPPPRAKVSRDTCVYRGSQARQRGILTIVLALIIASGTVFLIQEAERKLRNRLATALASPPVQTVFPAQ